MTGSIPSLIDSRAISSCNIPGLALIVLVQGDDFCLPSCLSINDLILRLRNAQESCVLLQMCRPQNEFAVYSTHLEKYVKRGARENLMSNPGKPRYVYCSSTDACNCYCVGILY